MAVTREHDPYSPHETASALAPEPERKLAPEPTVTPEPAAPKPPPRRTTKRKRRAASKASAPTVDDSITKELDDALKEIGGDQ